MASKVRDILRQQPSRVAEAGSVLHTRLFAPVDIASLVYFRIAFGSVMLWEVWRFIDHDWVDRYFSDKNFYFKFWPFDFVQPWPGVAMDIHIYLMAPVAILIILGLFYRLSAVLFFLMISYVFLLEEARYLNHLYLVCLISFLMIFVPAHRHFSLDSLLHPKVSSRVVPAWSVWLLRFQVGVPYYFGGIGKLNSDWLRGEPLRDWLGNRTDFPLLGQFFTNEAVVWLMNYGGLLLDLYVVFLLMNRRTRVLGFIGILTFHFMNSRLFGIGIFPWLMIASTAIFFEYDWPRRVLRDLRQVHPYRVPALIVGAILGFVIGGYLPDTFSPVRALIGAVGVAIAAYHLDEPFRRRGAESVSDSPKLPGPTTVQKWTLLVLGIWIAFQVIVPLRHFFIPGNVHWTEEGHNFSWHMKLRDKDSLGFFLVTDPTSGREWAIDPADFLDSRQTRKMTSRPHMIVEFARHIEGRLRDEGYENLEIRAHILASLNGRDPQLLIDPEVDLTKVAYPCPCWVMLTGSC